MEKLRTFCSTVVILWVSGLLPENAEPAACFAQDTTTPKRTQSSERHDQPNEFASFFTQNSGVPRAWDGILDSYDSTVFRDDFEGANPDWTHQSLVDTSDDNWMYDTYSSHSPTHGWTCLPGINLLCGLISYPVSLPAVGTGSELGLCYWVWDDQPGWQGHGNMPADYYDIWITSGDSTVRLVYDYAHDDGTPHPGGNSLTDWVYRKGGLLSPGVPASRIDLTPWAGHTIEIMFGAVYDSQDTSGSGSGIHIDDVEIVLSRPYNIDLATQDLTIPFPTTVGLLRPWTFDFKNEGLLAVSPIRGAFRYTRPNGMNTTDSIVVISGVLNSGEDTTVTRQFNPDMAGAWMIRVRSYATADQDPTNDTTYSPTNISLNPDSTLAVWVQPAGTYELGYNLRSFDIASLDPCYVHFTPHADGVPADASDSLTISVLRVMWSYDAGMGSTGTRTRIQFWEDGIDDLHIGSLLTTIETPIDTSKTMGAGGQPFWWHLNLAAYPELRCHSGNFWVSLTPLDMIGGYPSPLPLSKLVVPPAGDEHNYCLHNGNLQPSSERVLVQIVTVHDDSNCQPPVGRCCYGDPQSPSCADFTQTECTGLGGAWTVGLNCANNPCPVPIPCPDTSEYCNPPWPLDSLMLIASDVGADTAVVGQFDSNGWEIGGLYFWGVSRTADGLPCDEDPMTFEITFYEDNSGEPGSVEHSYTIPAAREATGNVIAGLPLYQFYAPFDTTCIISQGWIGWVGLQRVNFGVPANCVFALALKRVGQDFELHSNINGGRVSATVTVCTATPPPGQGDACPPPQNVTAQMVQDPQGNWRIQINWRSKAACCHYIYSTDNPNAPLPANPPAPGDPNWTCVHTEEAAGEGQHSWVDPRPLAAGTHRRYVMFHVCTPCPN